ncbi:10968_t:CDS:2 [Ambispora leptoticha]|uniref:10968_t:CDS:1 n=1 Tax=Ambispora leptoticha TaxID=144679 RepID=A0A9N9C1J3_9GLOM|nr:10968_t:CDS:2 [Ambispora leptoticha]
MVRIRFCNGHKFKKSDIITLELEPSNVYDKNVIKVIVDGVHKVYVIKNENNYNQSASLNLEYPWIVCERYHDILQALRDYDYGY